MQNALFPQDQVRLTQGRNGRVSHLGRNACDFASEGSKCVYAPYDCIVTRYDGAPGSYDAGFHTVHIESVGNVKGPNGKTGKQWMILLHTKSIMQIVKDSYSKKQTIPQGTYFYHEGDFGPGTEGVHVHIQCGWGTPPVSNWRDSGEKIEDCLFVFKGCPIVKNFCNVGGDSVYFKEVSDSVPDADWKKAQDDYAAAKKRKETAETARTEAKKRRDQKKRDYEDALKKQNEAEVALRSLGPKVDALEVQFKSGLNSIKEYSDTVFAL